MRCAGMNREQGAGNRDFALPTVDYSGAAVRVRIEEKWKI
jgi:hypothetical protein